MQMIVKDKSWPHIYFISSVLFFFIELSANMERQENSLKTLVSSFPLGKKKIKTKAVAALGLQSQTWQHLTGFVQIPMTACFPSIVPSPACFHLDWNSFSLPFPISLHCFLTAYLSHMFIFIQWEPMHNYCSKLVPQMLLLDFHPLAESECTSVPICGPTFVVPNQLTDCNHFSKNLCVHGELEIGSAKN